MSGVYAWFRDGLCVYVGMAGNLRSRLSAHLGTSRDMSRSTLRASVAVDQLKVDRHTARARPPLLSTEQAEIVNEWLRGCDVAWLTTASRAEADLLERQLRIEWLPRLNRA